MSVTYLLPEKISCKKSKNEYNEFSTPKEVIFYFPVRVLQNNS